MAVVLVTGAGLLIRTFWNLSRTDPGFDTAGVVKAQFALPRSLYPSGVDPARAAALYDGYTGRLLQSVANVPGVESAALTAFHPLETGFTQSFRVVGREAEGEHWPELPVRHVSPDYFRTLRVPLVRGRLLAAGDRAGATPVVVINEATADRFFAGRDPVGHQITFWGTNWTVVGVVGNERFQGIAKAPPIGAYAPLAQTRMGTLSLMVRTKSVPAVAMTAIRTSLRTVDPQLAVFGVEPLAETLAGTLTEQRFMMLLLGLFALLALVLAAIGVYGVLAYLVAQRTREIGVRMALGATSGRVIDLVVRQGMRLVAIGLVAGFVLALLLGRSLSSLLFGVAPTDLVTLVGVMVVLALVAAVAIWLPARRAVRVDPLTALHQE
jgi:putative ABC transport system permease protein